MDTKLDINHVVEMKDEEKLNHRIEKDIDELLEEADTFGFYKVAVHLSSFYLFLVVVYNFVLSYFTGDDPSWRCLSNKSSSFCAEHYNDVISREQGIFQQRCYLNRSEWTYTTTKDYSFVTEFDLICEKTALAATVSASYYIGGAIGAILSGTSADIFGRRPIIIFSTVLTMVSCIGHSYIRTLWQLLTLSVLRGIGSAGVFYTTLIYLSEFATPSIRVVTTNVLLLFGTTSFLSIDLIGYYIRNWRHLSTYAGWAMIPISIVFCFLPESPRWLLTTGNIVSAERVMANFCKFKNKPKCEIELKEANTEEETKKYTYLDLIRDVKVLKLTVSNVCLWFVIPVLYYSIALQSSSIGGNMYEAFALSTVADIPGTLLSTYLSNRIGRKKSILGGVFISGLLIGSMALVPQSYANRYVINITLSFLGRFSCCVAFYVMYTWSMELFPTVVRSQGLSVCAISDRLGMFIVPFITRICQKVSYTLPFIIMCISAVLAAISGLWLPETLHKPTRESFQDFFPDPSMELERVEKKLSLQRKDSGDKTERRTSSQRKDSGDNNEHSVGIDNVTLQMNDELS